MRISPLCIESTTWILKLTFGVFRGGSPTILSSVIFVLLTAIRVSIPRSVCNPLLMLSVTVQSLPLKLQVESWNGWFALYKRCSQNFGGIVSTWLVGIHALKQTVSRLMLPAQSVYVK